MERLVSFRLQKRVNIIFIELDIFIFVICGLREILRVPLTKIAFKGKWKIVMVFLFFYYIHHFPARGKEAEILETRSSCIPGSEVTLVWPPFLGFPLIDLGNFLTRGLQSFLEHYLLDVYCADIVLCLKLEEFASRPLDDVTIL